jgi:hypothetical protein
MQSEGRVIFKIGWVQAVGRLLTVLSAFISLSALPAQAQTLTQTTNLNFGTAAQGSPAKTVAPGTAQNTENGSFRVEGPANQSFTIVIPTGSILMTTQGTGANTIEVSNFQAFPFPTSRTNSQGRRVIFVGATRAAIAPNQVAGTYTGTYTIEVLF